MSLCALEDMYEENNQKKVLANIEKEFESYCALKLKLKEKKEKEEMEKLAKMKIKESADEVEQCLEGDNHHIGKQNFKKFNYLIAMVYKMFVFKILKRRLLSLLLCT